MKRFSYIKDLLVLSQHVHIPQQPYFNRYLNRYLNRSMAEYLKDLRQLALIRGQQPIIKATDIPKGDNRCYVCWSDYGTQEDATEPPCQAIKLQPCGHFIGDQCFRKMPFDQMLNCHLCQQPIEQPNPVPELLSQLIQFDNLLGLSLFPEVRRLTELLGKYALDTFDTIQMNLVRGTCTPRNGMLLGLYYLSFGVWAFFVAETLYKGALAFWGVVASVVITCVGGGILATCIRWFLGQGDSWISPLLLFPFSTAAILEAEQLGPWTLRVLAVPVLGNGLRVLKWPLLLYAVLYLAVYAFIMVWLICLRCRMKARIGG